jgi:putative selenium metabolism protein SsnA
MLIISGVKLIHWYPPVVSEPQDIAIEGSTIIAVGPNLKSRYPDAEVYAPGGYVSTGLVCSHNHFYSALARGLMVSIQPSKDFVQQLEHLWWRLDRALDENLIRYSGLAGASEAAFSGVSAVIDHHASPSCIDGSLDILREGFEQVGLRGILCYETTDRNGIEGAAQGIRENERFASNLDKEKKALLSTGGPDGRPGTTAASQTPLVEAAIGAHAPFTLGEDTLDALAQVCKATGRGLHIHAAEDKYDAVDSRYRFHQDIAFRLDEAGLLGPKTIIAHGLFISPEEIELCNDRQVFLAHNPRSNMNNQVGYNQTIGTWKYPVLGTDGIGSDMIEEAKFAFFKHRDAGGSLWMDCFLAMLQRGNEILERYFTGKRFGRIEAGYEADLTFWDYDPPTPLLSDNLAGHAAFGLSSRYVRSTMVGGRFVLKDRRACFDAAGIAAHSREQTQRLWQRMEEIR